MQIVVDDPEALACVATAKCSTHQVLNHQTHINKRDLVVWRKISLQKSNLHIHQKKALVVYTQNTVVRGCIKFRVCTCLTSLTSCNSVGFAGNCF